jgi:hypothetical protein
MSNYRYNTPSVYLMNNIYIECLEIGYEKHLNTGISYNDMIESLDLKFEGNEELETTFLNWFFKNFKNKHLHTNGDIVVSDDRRLHSQEFRDELLKSDKSFMTGNAIIIYLEYEELKQARIASKDANTHALEASNKARTAMWISIIALGLSLIIGIFGICLTISSNEDNNNTANQLLELEKEKLEIQNSLHYDIQTLKQTQLYSLDTLLNYIPKECLINHSNHN